MKHPERSDVAEQKKNGDFSISLSVTPDLSVSNILMWLHDHQNFK